MVVYCAIAYILYLIVWTFQRGYSIVYGLAGVYYLWVFYNAAVVVLLWSYYYLYTKTPDCDSLNDTGNKAMYLDKLYQHRDFERYEHKYADREICVESARIFQLTISLCILFSATVLNCSRLGGQMDNYVEVTTVGYQHKQREPGTAAAAAAAPLVATPSRVPSKVASLDIIALVHQGSMKRRDGKYSTYRSDHHGQHETGDELAGGAGGNAFGALAPPLDWIKTASTKKLF
ncbi:hypothetical protein E4U19_006675 [Claviceps sp. Clav32 group G5]|nr:hypothetical protein E4U19_006675 [Claviceps sp. Clav32 group G5]KAG6049673.1 hypothetical protein E4U39_005664 [Claviceps sp. Clav50 group G5]